MSETFNVQKAIYQAILASSVVGARVYDEVPESGDTEFPYVVIGERDGTPDDVTCQDGVDAFLTLHIWSRARGWKEVNDITDGLRPFLHAVEFQVEGRSSVHCWFELERSFRDPNGVDRHGVITLRILHHE